MSCKYNKDDKDYSFLYFLVIVILFQTYNIKSEVRDEIRSLENKIETIKKI